MDVTDREIAISGFAQNGDLSSCSFGGAASSLLSVHRPGTSGDRTSPLPTCPSGRRAIFLDRDGTLIAEREYLSDPAQVELIPGVPQALQRLQRSGFRLILVTNQSGIGRGYFTESDMHQVNRRLAELLVPHHVRIERIYFAPEAPDQPSPGRKPSPHFLFQARDELGLDLAQSYMVGDKLSDLECGWNAGVRQCLLVRTGYGAETEVRHPELRYRVVVVDDLSAAAAHLCWQA